MNVEENTGDGKKRLILILIKSLEGNRKSNPREYELRLKWFVSNQNSFFEDWEFSLSIVKVPIFL